MKLLSWGGGGAKIWVAGEGKIWELEIETWTLRVATCLTLLSLDVLWLVRAQYKEFLDAFLSVPTVSWDEWFLTLQKEKEISRSAVAASLQTGREGKWAWTGFFSLRRPACLWNTLVLCQHAAVAALATRSIDGQTGAATCFYVVILHNP